jgi:hypothetical protein
MSAPFCAGRTRRSFLRSLLCCSLLIAVLSVGFLQFNMETGMAFAMVCKLL